MARLFEDPATHRVRFVISGSKAQEKIVKNIIKMLPRRKASEFFIDVAKEAIRENDASCPEALPGDWRNITQISCTPEEKKLIDDFCQTRVGNNLRSRWLIDKIIKAYTVGIDAEKYKKTVYRGLWVTVYRSPETDNNTNLPSAKHEKMLLVGKGVARNGEECDPSKVLELKRDRSRNYFYARPINAPTTKKTYHSGSFAYCENKQFHDAAGFQPIPIHDKLKNH